MDSNSTHLDDSTLVLAASWVNLKVLASNNVEGRYRNPFAHLNMVNFVDNLAVCGDFGHGESALRSQ